MTILAIIRKPVKVYSEKGFKKNTTFLLKLKIEKINSWFDDWLHYKKWDI